MTTKKRKRKKKGGFAPFLLILLLGGAAIAGWLLKDCAFGFGTGTGDGDGDGKSTVEETTQPNPVKTNENVLSVTVEGIVVKKGDVASTVEAICAELKGKPEGFTLDVANVGGQTQVLDDLKKCAADNGVKFKKAP